MKNLFRVSVLLMLISGAVIAEDNWNIVNVTDLATDRFSDVKVVGDYAYCTTSYGITVMDVSDREHPEVINRIPLCDCPSSLEVRDSLLYVCGSYNGFYIFSISNPELPVEIGFSEDVRNPSRLELRDTLAFVACYRTGLSILSIADPYNPRVIGEVRPGFGDCEDVALNGIIAYLSDGFHVISIEDPTNPELICSVEGPIGEIEIQGNYLYSPRGIYSLENPLEPSFITRYYEVGDHWNQYKFDIHERNVFLGIKRRRDNHLYKVITCLDISDPEHLQEIGFAEMFSFDPSVAGKIEYENDYVYVTSEENGMSICDFRDLDHPEEVGTYVNAAFHSDIDIIGDYFYVADHCGNLRTYSVENPLCPVPVDSINWDASYWNNPKRLDADDDYMCTYLTYRDDDGHITEGIVVFSLAEPEAPEQIGWLYYHVVGSNLGLVLNGNYLYLSHWATRERILTVFSLTDPENPEIAGNYGDFYQGFGIDIEGDLLVQSVLDRDFTAIILMDISDPDSPVELGRCEMNGLSFALKIVADYIYFADFNTGIIYVVSISEPENPEIVSEYRSLSEFPLKMIYEDGCLFVTEWTTGLEVLSLEDPEHPVLTGWYDTPHISNGIVVRDDLAYIADGSDIGVYDVSQALGAWYLALSEETHNFGEVSLDSTSEWELTIRNLSASEREITDIIIDNEVFTCSFDTSFILPEESDTTLIVSFTPVIDTTYTGVLDVVSGDHSLPVSLSGQGIRIGAVAEGPEVAYDFKLKQAFPNPFNSSTRIEYSLPYRSEAALRLYDLSGRSVMDIFQGIQPPGVHAVTLSAADLPSGLYFVRLEASGQVFTQKVMLIR